MSGSEFRRLGGYAAEAPLTLGRHYQQIRATIQGTPQIAGSVDISASGRGKAFISNLQVNQLHRRRGVARKLIDAVITNTRRQGFTTAWLEARPFDTPLRFRRWSHFIADKDLGALENTDAEAS